MSTGVATELDEIADLWPRVSKIIYPLYTSSDYERARSLLDAAIDRTGGDEAHPLAALVDFLGLLIEDYEDSHVPAPEGEAISVLRYLMEEHGVSAGDLAEIAPQAEIQEILEGQRPMNIEQIAAVSRRFHVSPSVFIPVEFPAAPRMIGGEE